MDNIQNIETLFPRMSVGIMGSAGGKLDDRARDVVQDLGRNIARRGFVLVTGACPGIPQEAVKGAKKEGGIVIGVSPALNLEDHVKKYHSPTRGYDIIVYTGNGLMGHEIENIRSCDVVIFAGGRSGTLGEFAIAYDEAKVIGVLEGTGGITEHLKEIIGMMKKDTGAIITYDVSPECLLDGLERIYKEQILPGHFKALDGHNPDGTLE
jgi:uncharacterized protein (TIGR00725 family)